MVRLFHRYERMSTPEEGSETALTPRLAFAPPKICAKVGSELGKGLVPSSSSDTTQKSSVPRTVSPLEVVTIRVCASEPRLDNTCASTVTGAGPELVRISRYRAKYPVSAT